MAGGLAAAVLALTATLVMGGAVVAWAEGGPGGARPATATGTAVPKQGGVPTVGAPVAVARDPSLPWPLGFDSL